ncbi:MAG: Peptidase family [Candidatus Parcubacteria bacterium]|jgi:Zn-dependent protease with chaperone function
MPFRSYKSFVRFHKARMAVLMLLPFVFSVVWCSLTAYLFGDVRYPVVLWVMVMLFTLLLVITPPEACSATQNTFVCGTQMPPSHHADSVVHRLRQAGCLPAHCTVHLDTTQVLVPRIYACGTESASIVLSRHDYPLWRHGVAEAVIMHEVGHVTGPLALAVTLNSTHALCRVLCVTALMHLAVWQTVLDTSLSIVALFGAICCLATILMCELVLTPLRHSAEYVADSHAVKTGGVAGARGLMSYFEDGLYAFTYHTGGVAISPQKKSTHPAPTDRIAALRLYIRNAVAADAL